MRFSTLITISLAALCAFGATGCSGDTTDDITDALLDSVLPGGGEAKESHTTAAGKQMCQNALLSVARNGVPTECDVAIATDCEEIVGLFSDSYVDAIARCLNDDDTPAFCILEATLALQPTEAHYELASAYCNECAFEMDGCEDIFYFGRKDQLGLGMVALPFNDDVVREIAQECTDELMCAVELPSCAQEILLNRAIPEKTLACILNPLN